MKKRVWLSVQEAVGVLFGSGARCRDGGTKRSYGQWGELGSERIKG